jgi:DNA-binding XRE family transcriptional regulator
METPGGILKLMLDFRCRGDTFWMGGKMVAFSKKIRDIRHSLGWTQEEFGRLLGNVTKLTIKRWEAGTQVPRYAEMILRAAESLPKSKTPRAGKRGRKPSDQKGGR